MNYLEREQKRQHEQMVRKTRRGTDTWEAAPPRPPQGPITRKAMALAHRAAVLRNKDL